MVKASNKRRGVDFPMISAQRLLNSTMSTTLSSWGLTGINIFLAATADLRTKTGMGKGIRKALRQSLRKKL